MRGKSRGKFNKASQEILAEPFKSDYKKIVHDAKKTIVANI